MTARHTRIVTLGAILMALAHGMAVQSQTLDALRTLHHQCLRKSGVTVHVGCAASHVRRWASAICDQSHRGSVRYVMVTRSAAAYTDTIERG